MALYINVPIETDPEDLIDEAVAALQAKFPGWQPADGNLDYWMLQVISTQGAELRDVASLIPDSIFRYFGDTIMGIPPLDAEAATTTSTWTVIDNAGYTIPAGTQVGIRTSGDELVPFYTQNAVTIAPGGNTTAVGAVTLVAVNEGADASGIGAIGGPAELMDVITFVTGITITAPTAGGQDAEADDVYLDRLTRELTLQAPRPILPSDFAIMALDIAGVARATAIDGYNPLHNLLTANEASVETDISGWQNDTNATVTRSAAQAADGVASMSMASVAAGTMDARSARAIPVVANDYYTALASVRAATVARSTRVGIRWYSDAGGTVLISTAFGGAVNDTTTGFTNLSLVGATAPSTAVTARIVVEVTATGGVAEVHYSDKMSLRRGVTSDWVAGGTNETGNARMITLALVDAFGNAVSAGVKAAVQTLLQSRREVNFVVNTMDPTYTQVAITWSAKAVAGYDTADVLARVNTALTNYLTPSNWGGDFFDTGQVSVDTWANLAIVRLYEVAQVINGVVGVDYITALTLGKQGGVLAAADYTLPGAIPMPQPGTLTGAVT